MISNCDVYYSWQDVMYIVATMYGEARGECRQGKVAVAHVILNRVTGKSWFGDNIQDVILKPFQFSCWNDDDPNYEKVDWIAHEWHQDRIEMLNDEDIVSCIEAALSVLSGSSPDNTGGATHYCVNTLRPSWYDKDKITVTIGDHTFFKNID